MRIGIKDPSAIGTESKLPSWVNQDEAPALKVINKYELGPGDIIFWEAPVGVYDIDSIEEASSYLRMLFPNNQVITLFGQIDIIKGDK